MAMEGVEMTEEQLNQAPDGDAEDEEQEDEEDGGDGGDNASTPAAPQLPPEQPQSQPSVAAPRPKTTMQQPRGRGRPPVKEPKPTYDETPPADEEGDGESIWRSRDSLTQRRMAKLMTMLESYPKVTKDQRKFLREMCDQDPTILDNPRQLFDMMSDWDKTEPRMLRRIVDIVFSEQDPGFPDDAYAPPYGQQGYGGRSPNPYTRDTFERLPYGQSPSQGDRYSYDRPPPSSRGGQGMISVAEHERMLDYERRAMLLETENRRLRGENRMPPAAQQPPPQPKEDYVEIKRPILTPDGQQVVEWQHERIPKDVYKDQLAEERLQKMVALVTARNQPERPEQNAEVTALKDQVAALTKLIEAKEKDKQLEGLKSDIGGQLQSATRNMVELQKRTDARLAEIEKMKGAGGQPGEMGDDARIIVAEIHEGSLLTTKALDRASDLAEKYMDMQVKTSTPNRPKKLADRSRYKEELDEEEVRILNEELPDGDVDED